MPQTGDEVLRKSNEAQPLLIMLGPPPLERPKHGTMTTSRGLPIRFPTTPLFTFEYGQDNTSVYWNLVGFFTTCFAPRSPLWSMVNNSLLLHGSFLYTLHYYAELEGSQWKIN